METNLMLIIGISFLIGMLILIIVIFLIFRAKRPVQLTPQQLRIENDKKFKIKGILNDGINAMMEQDSKRAIYNFSFAKSIYQSLRNRDLDIEKGLEELYRMIPKHGLG